MRTILHLDADAFFATAEKGINPLLKDKPVIVGGLPHQRGCVHTASYEARRMGVYTGMSLREAKEKCPEAVFIKGDYRHYRAIGITILRILHSFSPDVELASIDDAYVDLTGVKHLHPNPVDVAVEIQKRIRDEAHVTVSLGIASTKLTARIASGINKPEGITSVPHGSELAFLSVLPIRELRGIGGKSERILNEIGIHTIGELSKLPKFTVIQLLGNSAGTAIWHYAKGVDTREVMEKEISKQLSRETSFEEDTDDPALIRGTLLYLTDRIAAKLRKMDWTARRLFVKIRYADGTSHKKYVTLTRHTDDGNELSKRVLAIYQGFPFRRIRVKLVGIKVMEIEHKLSQGTIFDETERFDKLNIGIDSVRKRFGFSSVYQASTLVLQNHYRMENHGYILHTPSLSQ